MEPKNVKSDLVLILNYGSHYTHLVTCCICSFLMFSLCIFGTSSLGTITVFNPSIIILSSGPNSIHTLTPMLHITTSTLPLMEAWYQAKELLSGARLVEEDKDKDVIVGEDSNVVMEHNDRQEEGGANVEGDECLGDLVHNERKLANVGEEEGVGNMEKGSPNMTMRRVTGRFDYLKDSHHITHEAHRKLTCSYEVMVCPLRCIIGKPDYLKGNHHVTHDILNKPNIVGRMVKWSDRLFEFDLYYEPWASIKVKVLVDFLIELTPSSQGTNNRNQWILSVDGASNQ
ncbi:hypothetical protein CR513_00472, partial [Mucuna pruriens]